MSTVPVDSRQRRINIRLALVLAVVALGFYGLMWLWGVL
jgi:predicted secreted protein